MRIGTIDWSRWLKAFKSKGEHEENPVITQRREDARNRLLGYRKLAAIRQQSKAEKVTPITAGKERA